MTIKIVVRWLLFVFAPFVIGVTIYRQLIGPTSQYLPLAIPFIFLFAVPVAYLSLDWKYIQTTRFGGSFDEVDAPKCWIISIPGIEVGDINISKFDHHTDHLNRWIVYTSSESMFTFFCDRLTKKWYYHFYDPKYKQIMELLKKARTSL